MPRIYSWLAVMCLLLVWTAPAWSEVSTSVDRQELAVGETLVLSIEASGFKFSQPDLSVLDLDFNVLGTSQSSQSQWINGKLSSVTRWSIQLAPKRAGKTSIAPIKVGKEKTRIIEIQVNHQPSQNADQDNIDIMLEAELADNTIYVGAQTQLKIKVSAAIPANIRVDEPQHDAARIEQINKVSYQQVRAGQQLRVTEYTYVMIPTQTGELVLEPLNLVAELAANQPRSLRRPFMGQSRRVIRRSDPLTLNVIPPPDGNDPASWLPAKKVTLKEHWSQDPASLQVGDSVTRTIEFKAEGALASQLPALFMPDIPGLKLYPDQPNASDSSNANGISGQRVEKVALVATRPGRFELPALTVAWWDVDANQAMESRLPARTIEVSPSSQSAEATPDPTAVTTPAQSSPPATPATPWYRYSQWWWICAVLTIGLAVIGTLYARSRHQLGQLQELPATPSANDTLISNEAEAFEQLQQACHTNRHTDVYSRLLQWARLYWGKKLGGVNELEQVGANRQLVQQATALAQQLYGDGAKGRYQSQRLLDAVTQQRESNAEQSDKQTLPPLYQH
jgi:hypothetical protein